MWKVERRNGFLTLVALETHPTELERVDGNERRNCDHGCSTTYIWRDSKALCILLVFDSIAIVCWKKKLSRLPTLQDRPNAAGRESEPIRWFCTISPVRATIDTVIENDGFALYSNIAWIV